MKKMGLLFGILLFSIIGCSAVQTASTGPGVLRASSGGPATIQAEDACSFDGTVGTSCSGYLGTGYVDLADTSSAGLTFAVASASSQTVTMSIRFSNEIISRTIKLRRISPSTTSYTGWALAKTTNCSTWSSKNALLPCVSGDNIFEIRRMSASWSGLHLDQIVVPEEVTPAFCGPTNTPTPENTPTFTLTSTKTWTPTMTDTPTPENTPTSTLTFTQTSTPTITNTPGEQTLFLRSTTQHEGFQTQGGFSTTARALNPSAGIVPVVDLSLDDNETELGYHLGTWFSNALGETTLPNGPMRLNLFAKRLEATASHLNPYFYVADWDEEGGLGQIYCSGQATLEEIPQVAQLEDVEVFTNLGDCPCSSNSRVFVEVYVLRNGGGKANILAAFNNAIFNSRLRHPITP